LAHWRKDQGANGNDPREGPYQWQAQIRRKGWPNQNATFRTRKDAEAWARKAESGMDRGLFVISRRDGKPRCAIWSTSI
jgi:hypothetical protein